MCHLDHPRVDRNVPVTHYASRGQGDHLVIDDLLVPHLVLNESHGASTAAAGTNRSRSKSYALSA